MRCRNCQHEFCWICFETWFGHTTTVHANCGLGLGDGKNKGKGLAEASVVKDAAATKTELQRYIFFFERYTN